MLPDSPNTLLLNDYVQRKSAEVAEKLAIEDIRYSGSHSFEVVRPSVEVFIDGSLVKITTKRIKIKNYDNETIRGIRGEIVSFSRASRRRLMRLIAKTDRSNRPLFVTLTYPDVFEDDMDKWKRDIDVFGKRFARLFTDASFVWRVEFKARKTGSSKGLVAPHYHLLVWGVGLSELREFCSRAWFEVVGSENEDHLRAGSACQYLRKWSGTASYVSKYIAKLDEMPRLWKGRVWGVISRKNIPWSAVVVIYIENEVAVRTVRLARKIMGLKGKVLRYGITWMVGGDRFLDYLEWAIGLQ